MPFIVLAIVLTTQPCAGDGKWSRLIASGLSQTELYAMRPPNIFYHNVGLLRVMVTNVGVIGNPSDDVGSFSAEWQGGEYLNKAELWVGAVASDNVAYVSSGFEFRPSLDPIDTIYPSFEGASGGNRAGFSLNQGDDDGDGLHDEDPLNGKDDDGDGLIDEDYEAISQQMLSCEYWDYTNEAVDYMPEHRPLHLKVRQRSFCWSMDGQNEFVGFEYRITNDGYEALHDLYVGWFVDADIGRKDAAEYWADDLAAVRSVDTTYVDEDLNFTCRNINGTIHHCGNQRIHIDLASMHDARGPEGGEYLDDLPSDRNASVGVLLLDHTTDILGERAPTGVGAHTLTIMRTRETENLDDLLRYRLLAQGAHFPDSADVPSDYCLLLSVGPFSELLPGEEVKFQVALLVGLGWKGLLANAIEIKKVYRGKWRDADNDRHTGCDGRETCLPGLANDEPFWWYDPCVVSGTRRKVFPGTCEDPADWVDNDCDCCTPPQPRSWDCEGLETLVPWVGALAPPTPTVSTNDPATRVSVEGNRSIYLEWDNYPELVPDPVTGRVLFCGYRIWRVEGWNRPPGSLGPTPDEWQLIADLKRWPVGTQLSLHEFTNPHAQVVRQIPSPTQAGVWGELYEIGRYFYEDTLGLKNGMLYFYDVTSYACWFDAYGRYHDLSQPPTALEAEGVRPRWDTSPGESWQQRLAVVPNPYRGGAAWDLHARPKDPSGTHIAFTGMPDRSCDIRIYSLAGDLVQTLHHDGAQGDGTVRWRMLSRNGQAIVSGVYLYAVTCGGETVVRRFTVIR
ncbi:MAG: hypothetical protein KAY24_06755 [Candidatus Eisenbacteria sp.]|nr:hypothetical protein [Candidatus Eisenbacteria bacterium]